MIVIITQTPVAYGDWGWLPKKELGRNQSRPIEIPTNGDEVKTHHHREQTAHNVPNLGIEDLEEFGHRPIREEEVSHTLNGHSPTEEGDNPGRQIAPVLMSDNEEETGNQLGNGNDHPK